MLEHRNGHVYDVPNCKFLLPLQIRFEPRTFRSQSERATKLRYTPFRVVEADAGLGAGRGIRTPSPERPDLQSGAPRQLRRAGVVVPEVCEFTT